MSKKEEFKRDNFEETKKGMKEVGKIIFRTNEYVPDDWTDFDVTPEEARILKEGVDYVEKELAPSLSIYRKVSKEELLDNDEPEKEVVQAIEEVQVEEIEQEEQKESKSRFTEAEIAEMNSLLKQKSRNLKLRTEKVAKDKNLKLKEEEIKKKKEELERLNR